MSLEKDKGHFYNVKERGELIKWFNNNNKPTIV
jgi:hypothetical protein